MFFERSLNEEVKIAKPDAKEATKSIIDGIGKFCLV
jgi:hypothetical protein